MTERRLMPFWKQEAGSTGLRFVDVGGWSRWFDTITTGRMAAGQSDGVRAFPPREGEHGAESWYFVTSGTAIFVQPDGTTILITPYDGIFLPPGSGGELRATSDLEWLVLSSHGGKPTPFSDAGGRGAATLIPNDRAGPAEIFRRAGIAPRQWPANSVGASHKPYWFYTVDDHSSWFHSACISCVAPGGATALHSHIETYEGPYESWYIVLEGTGLIRNEYEDFLFEGGPAGAFVPADTSHQLINNGTGFLWYLTISSRGTEPLRVDTYNTPAGAERPGYVDEYNRILASRADRGLPVP